MLKLMLILIAILGGILVQARPPLKIKVGEDFTYLVMNDGTDRRAFLSGMVDNWPSKGQDLSCYSHDQMEKLMKALKDIGCNAMRWNAFLKGLDFTYERDINGTNHTIVSRFKEEYIDNLEDGLNLGKKYGIMVQVVLSSAHFMTYGPGGINGTQAGIRNGDRVSYMGQMFSTDYGTEAYINNVIMPIIKRINGHDAFVGYLLINEPHGMTDPRDIPHNDNIIGASWTDEYVRLKNFQNWITRVAGSFHRFQLGVLCSVSIIGKFMSLFENEFLNMYQFQYYPLVHNKDGSPFQFTPMELVGQWGGSYLKPAIAGEFPVKGIEITKRNDQPLTPEEAYEMLWNNCFSGGFTWNSDVYFHLNSTQKQPIDDGYRIFHEKHLKNTTEFDL